MILLRKLSFLIVVYLYFVSASTALAATRIWDGGGGDNNWSTCANWDGPDICPLPADTVTFNSTSAKNSTVDVGYTGSISIFTISSGYTGTITVAETLAITSTFTQSGGTFNLSNQPVSFSATTTINVGSTFIASSSTTTINKSLVINGGTFNANGGIIDLAGGSASLSCNNVTFNSVTFAGQTGTKTIGSNCSLPLGNNPNIPLAIGLSGTLSGSGTLTLVSGTSTMSTGSVLSGFSTLTTTAFVMNGGSLGSVTTFSTTGSLNIGATWDASTITSFTAGGSFNLNTGGNFTAPSNTMFINGVLAINAGIFNANNGTVDFAGGSASLSCNNITFNNVSFSGQTSTKTIGSNCQLPLGNNPTIPNSITLSGSLSGTGTISFSAGTFYVDIGSSLSGLSAINPVDMTINGGNLGNVSSLTSSGTLSITGNFNAGSFSTFITNGPLVISAGANFTAPSGTLNLNNALTVTAGTFDANGGTVDIGGTNATLSCNNITFNSVNFTGQTGTKTISSNCSLPLGTNPIIPNSISLSGVLSGGSTLAFTAGTFTQGVGSSLSGFSSLNPSAYTYNGGSLGGISNIIAAGNISVSGTLDVSAFTSFVANGTLTLNSNANFSGSNNLTTNSTFTMSSGSTFTASSGTTVINKSFTVNGGTFIANGGIVDFAGGGATLSCNNISFNLVTFIGQTSSKVISSNCSLPLGNNPTIPLAITLNGSLYGTGTLSLASGTSTINSGAVLSGFITLNTTAFVMNGGSLGAVSTFSTTGSLNIGGTWDASTISSFTAGGSFNMNSGGQFTAPTGNLNINGILTMSGGNFNANNGTVVLGGTSQSISGAYTFYNLTKNISLASDTLTFPAFTTTTVTNILSLNGSAAAILSLRSSTTLTQWSIDPQGQRILSYLDVKDSNNINATQIDAGTGSVSSGSNNTGWNFPPTIITSNTYYVSPSGSDSNIGTSSSPFATITHAVSVTNAGDTVRLLPGTFSEHVIIQNKHGTSAAPIRIVGDTTDHTQYPTVDGGDPTYASSSSTAFLAFLVQNSSWLDFERIKVSNSSESAFKLDSSHYITFRRNIFEVHRYGVLVDGKTSHTLMEYNEAYQMFPDGSTWTQLKSSKWEGGAYTSFGGAGMSIIRYNYFHKMFNAVYLSTSSGFLSGAADANLWVYRNRFENIVDDPYEPESFAYNNHFFYNTLVNTHRMVSLAIGTTGLLGPIYIYGNAQINTSDPTLEVPSGKRNSAWKVDLSTEYYANGVLAFNNSIDISTTGSGGYGLDKLTSNGVAINNLNLYNNAYQTLNQTYSQSSLNLINSDFDYEMSQTSLGYTETNGFPNTTPGFSDSANEDFRLVNAAPAIGQARQITASIGFTSTVLVAAGSDLGAYQFGQNDFVSVPDPIYEIPPGGEDPTFPINESWPGDIEPGFNPLSGPVWFGVTPTPTLTPTSTDTPIISNTPTPTSTGSPIPTDTPTQTPTVTPTTVPTSQPPSTPNPTQVPASTSTPTPNPVSSNPPSTNNPSTGSCNDPISLQRPDLFEIQTSNNTATLFFSPPPMPYSSFYVSYSRKLNDWEYGAQFNQGYSSGVIKFTINSLAPNTRYYFKIHTINGCSSADWGNTMLATTTSSKLKTKISYKNTIVAITRSIKKLFTPKPIKKTVSYPISTPIIPKPTINLPNSALTPPISHQIYLPTPTPTLTPRRFCIFWWCF